MVSVRPRASRFPIASPLQAIEQLTVTTLRNIVGALTLEEALTSRERVNTELRVVLDERTGKWGIRVNGVERLHWVSLPAGATGRPRSWGCQVLQAVADS